MYNQNKVRPAAITYKELDGLRLGEEYRNACGSDKFTHVILGLMKYQGLTNVTYLTRSHLHPDDNDFGCSTTDYFKRQQIGERIKR